MQSKGTDQVCNRETAARGVPVREPALTAHSHCRVEPCLGVSDGPSHHLSFFARLFRKTLESARMQNAQSSTTDQEALPPRGASVTRAESGEFPGQGGTGRAGRLQAAGKEELNLPVSDVTVRP